MQPSRVLGMAAVFFRGVCAGTIDSRNGNATVTPAPRKNVRRERCFLVMNIYSTPFVRKSNSKRVNNKSESTVNTEAQTLTASRRHPFERQLLHSRSGLSDVEIAFRIDCDLVASPDDAGRLDLAHNFERLAIDDENLGASTNIKELLSCIGRKSQI